MAFHWDAVFLVNPCFPGSATLRKPLWQSWCKNYLNGTFSSLTASFRLNTCHTLEPGRYRDINTSSCWNMPCSTRQNAVPGISDSTLHTLLQRHWLNKKFFYSRTFNNLSFSINFTQFSTFNDFIRLNSFSLFVIRVKFSLNA